MSKNNLALIIDEDFTLMHNPAFPKPSFISFENPSRISRVLEFLKQKDVFSNVNIIKSKPKEISESILELAHSKYHIDSIKRITTMGGGLIDDEVFVTEDSFD